MKKAWKILDANSRLCNHLQTCYKPLTIVFTFCIIFSISCLWQNYKTLYLTSLRVHSAIMSLSQKKKLKHKKEKEEKRVKRKRHGGFWLAKSQKIKIERWLFSAQKIWPNLLHISIYIFLLRHKSEHDFWSGERQDLENTISLNCFCFKLLIYLTCLFF